MSSGPDGTTTTDLATRFAAKLIDFVLLWLATVLLGTLAVLLSAAVHLAGSSLPWVGDRAWGVFLPGSGSAVVTAALYLGYFTLMEHFRGQTIGKLVLRVGVVAVDGVDSGRPSLEQALKRNLWTAIGALSVLPLVGTFLTGLAGLAAVLSIAITISNDPQRRGWHDHIGGTSVVRATPAA